MLSVYVVSKYLLVPTHAVRGDFIFFGKHRKESESLDVVGSPIIIGTCAFLGDALGDSCRRPIGVEVMVRRSAACGDDGGVLSLRESLLRSGDCC